jgi:hypothetical protein
LKKFWEVQATKRLHRAGQLKEVWHYKVACNLPADTWMEEFRDSEGWSSTMLENSLTLETGKSFDLYSLHPEAI